jgi:protoheme IX farnesyltransferase
MKTATDVTEFTPAALATLALPASPMRTASLPAQTASLPRSRLADFIELTKPRMNFLVVLTTLVGYYMAAGSQQGISWIGLVHTILGTAAMAAAASALNQYAEREFDALMPRTAHRPLPCGGVTPLEALIFGVALGVGGVLDLWFCVNPLTAMLGAGTLLAYVFAYTPLKRRTTLCTVIGALPGAIPPVMGFTARSGHLSAQACALFAVLFLWQMPHFLAIAILYREDYAAGGFRMLPVVDADLYSTGRQIILYGAALIPISLMPVALNMTGTSYLVAAVVLGLLFGGYGLMCAWTRRRADARRLFVVSIIYLPLLLAAMMLDKQ